MDLGWLAALGAFGLAAYTLVDLFRRPAAGRQAPAAPRAVKALPRRGLRGRRQLAGGAPGGQRSAGSASVNGANPRSAQQTAENASVQRSAFSVPGSAAQPPALVQVSTEELTQLAKALELKAAGATKQAALEQAFSCSKGGGKTWRRAVALYDLAAGDE